MDSSGDRTHRTGTTTTSEFFICFTSRLSSSSMKISSKSSILSPGRARDAPISLSTSLSRRLRTSGSIKNGLASPMFPTGGRKRGSGFENPEPSSPKVTCIGQVRVKTKKQGKKMRTLSSRSRRSSGEISFRKIEHAQIQRQGSVNNQYHQQQQECSSHRNQRWVHLPLTICETLRGFGAEFSCLFPCKSSCFSVAERDKEDVKVGREGNGGGSGGQGSCVSVFARWLMAVQDGEGGKGREIELVVGGGDEEEEMPVRSSRRHVFDELEIMDDIFGVKDSSVEGGEEGRVSICVPPKNALLLMRCRSDPVKMEALANRFWEPQLPKEEEEEDGEERENDGKKEEVVHAEKVGDKVENFEVSEERRMSVSVDTSYEEQENNPEAENGLEMEVQDNEEVKIVLEDLEISEEVKDGEQEKEEETDESKIPGEEENELSFLTALEAFVDQESESEEVDKHGPVGDKNEEESRVSYSYNSFTPHSDEEICKPEENEEEKEELAEEPALELDAMELSTAEKETQGKNLQVKTMEKVTQEEDEESIVKTEEKERERESVEVLERESDLELKKKEREGSSLPDCLLLMMCEPKLSMEVSKETWVCSTDFIRWQPQKKKLVKVKESDGGDEPTKNRVSVDSNSANPFAALHPPHPAAQQPLLQPPRSSCSLPAAAVSMATMIEQKLVNAVAYEPFVLTRCKSEPMRTASKLAQDACFWKNGGLEPHRRSTVGVGAAGVGF